MFFSDIGNLSGFCFYANILLFIVKIEDELSSLQWLYKMYSEMTIKKMVPGFIQHKWNTQNAFSTTIVSITLNENGTSGSGESFNNKLQLFYFFLQYWVEGVSMSFILKKKWENMFLFRTPCIMVFLSVYRHNDICPLFCQVHEWKFKEPHQSETQTKNMN